MKNIILFITFLICLVLTSFIKNNTRTIEKKLFTLDNETKNLIYKLDEANLELEYLTTPENSPICENSIVSSQLTPIP